MASECRKFFVLAPDENTWFGRRVLRLEIGAQKDWMPAYAGMTTFGPSAG
ncbi:MAG: hypothetical protein L6Q71_00270 [Planctomycetes bacterium]|nr:hypothetical protein [Planctomycetota bacterium]